MTYVDLQKVFRDRLARGYDIVAGSAELAKRIARAKS